MPFPVSISFSANSLPLRTSSTMAQSSGSQQIPRRNPAISSGVKRARPRGLWKARGSGPRLAASTAAAPPPLPTPAELLHPRRVPPESDSDSDRVSYTSLSTDLDDTPHALRLVTKHQHQQHPPQDYFSAIPQPDYNSSDDDSTTWATRTKIMDISTTAGPGDPASDPNFTYDDWLDLQQLFNKACEQYEFDDPAEILPLFRGVIHECHRCLIAYHDPSHLFVSPPTPITQTKLLDPSPTIIGQVRPVKPLELPTAFHSLLGTALFYFGNLMAANRELALPGEPPNPVPYWIAALDVFESGENLPSRVEGHANPMPNKFVPLPTDYATPGEDWRMAIMWGRTLVALATEIVDRNRGKPPPPPQPQTFDSPFPTNKDYMKTGTIWDEEPEWPPESPFGVITTRRPPITRRMSLNYATPHEMLQLAMDHISRGIFHLPHNAGSASLTHLPPSRQFPAPPFIRGKVLYEVAEEVLLLAEKLDDPEERREWANYADSVFGQIHVSIPNRYQEFSPVASSSKETSESRPVISEGMVAKARGRAWLVIGSTIAESIEERMDQGSETENSIESLMRSEEAAEARDALTRAIELFERAKSFISAEAWAEEGEEGNDDNEDDGMLVDEDDDADDEQEAGVLMSARARGKQRRDSKVEDARRASRLEAKRASRAEANRLRQQEAEHERLQLSHLLAEALCSLANLTESKEQQEEYYRRAEAETGVKLFDDEDKDNDNMDEGH